MKPRLNSRIFWDVDPAGIDYERNARFVIERVFGRGDIDDIRQVRRYYGDNRVIDVLKNARWLDYGEFVFVKNLFNLQSSDFRCYTLNQLSHSPWTY